ncbi:MAG: hypothetical protein IH631_10810 [Candidatus Thorarchaeota archaeon]|nr:hypothetical protein [Candidatus Thorarchaeota archaeon]
MRFLVGMSIFKKEWGDRKTLSRVKLESTAVSLAWTANTPDRILLAIQG